MLDEGGCFPKMVLGVAVRSQHMLRVSVTVQTVHLHLLCFFLVCTVKSLVMLFYVFFFLNCEILGFLHFGILDSCILFQLLFSLEFHPASNYC